MITHGAMVCDFTSEVRLAWLLRTRSRNAADMLAPYTFSASSQMAIHNLLKAWGFHNRAVLHYQRMLMAQQMMNKPVRQDGIHSEHVAVLFSAAPPAHCLHGIYTSPSGQILSWSQVAHLSECVSMLF
jgi:hypothetical protein